MATQIIILPGESILLDQEFKISWADKGNSMPALPNTIHCVLWNNLPGQNEIQSKDPATGNMTGNTDLNATSDAVGSTTVAALLTWGETRKGQIYDAITAYDDAVTNGTASDGETWRDYDPNYS